MSYSPTYNYSLCSEHQILSFPLRLNFHFTPWIAILVPMCFCMLWGKRLKITELSAVSKVGMMKVSYLFSPSVSLCVGQSRQPQQKSHFFFFSQNLFINTVIFESCRGLDEISLYISAPCLEALLGQERKVMKSR